MNKAKKAEYARKYRATHQKQINEYRRAYYKKNKAKIAKQAAKYYKKNKAARQEYGRTYYYKNQKRMDKVHRTYSQLHRDEINEWQRKRWYRRQGRRIPTKSFSFYRDFIKKLSKLSEQDRSIIYQALLSLPLTKTQRKLVSYTKNGLKQKDIGKELKIGQAAICCYWNGANQHGRYYGGVYNKFVKEVNKNKSLRDLLTTLNLQWHRLDHGKKSDEKRQIPMGNSRSFMSRGGVE